MNKDRITHCPIHDKDFPITATCPCGWPEQPCIVTWPELRTDQPPEPGCYDDGETWRSC
jgi:hypothetical protein